MTPFPPGGSELSTPQRSALDRSLPVAYEVRPPHLFPTVPVPRGPSFAVRTNEGHAHTLNSVCISSDIGVALPSPKAALPVAYAAVVPRFRSLALGNMTGFS